MTAKIIEGHFNTTLPVPAEKVLKGALEYKLSDVIIIGKTDDGDLYLASSMPEAPEILWLLENAKCFILSPERE